MIRPVALSDAEAVYQLMCELEECELPRGSFGTIFDEQLSSAHYRAFVYEGVEPGEQTARVLGFINMRIEGQLHHAADVAEIMELVVDPGVRSAGIGGELFERACQEARTAGCEQIELTSNARRHAAHRFYERRGMERTHVKFVMPLGYDETVTPSHREAVHDETER